MSRKFIAIVVLTVLWLLVASPLSEGYDFIGKPNHGRRNPRGEAAATEKRETPAKEEEAQKLPKEKEVVSEEAEDTVEETTTLPEPQEEEVKKPVNYIEVTYESLVDNNELDKILPSESGNYIIIYSTTPCQYCDRLIAELKDNVGDYNIVVIKCKGSCRDLYYRQRWVYSFPSFLVIKGNSLRYYGAGYRMLEEFKRLL